MIDADGLEAFVAIAAECSFSRGAKQLGIAQSVISKRLRRLEDQLGTSLIDRSKRNDIRLTRLGEIYLPEVQHVLHQLRQVEQVGMDLARGRTGPVRIGYIFSSAMNGTLSRLLSHLANALPAVELRPRLMETPEQLTALEKGDLEIGLIRPRPSYPETCKAKLVQQERLNLFLANSHSLASRQSITSYELAEECFIVPQFQEQVGLINRLEDLARTGNFPLENVIRTDDFVTTSALVATCKGVALAPQSLAALGIEGLVAKEISDFDHLLDLMLIYPTNLPKELARLIEGMPAEQPSGLL